MVRHARTTTRAQEKGGFRKPNEVGRVPMPGDRSTVPWALAWLRSDNSKSPKSEEFVIPLIGREVAPLYTCDWGRNQSRNLAVKLYRCVSHLLHYNVSGESMGDNFKTRARNYSGSSAYRTDSGGLELSRGGEPAAGTAYPFGNDGERPRDVARDAAPAQKSGQD